MAIMRVLLSTSWNQPQCGIQAHSELLITHATAADPDLQILPSAESLNPDQLPDPRTWDLLHLNYHRALHSRWTPDRVQQIQQVLQKPVVVTFHDTYGEHPPDRLSLDLYRLAQAFVVHEPCQDLPKARYWRQAVPETRMMGYSHPERPVRPIVGTVGFDFGWKNYDRLCLLAERAGWGVLICCPEMHPEREAQLKALNPWLVVHRNLPTALAVATLRQCDATAFLYVCGNSGTSAAIRMGIAAGQPVIAFHTCRQFRDLLLDPVGETAITWIETEAQFEMMLGGLPHGRLDPDIVRLAHQDSWVRAGQQYAALYRRVAADWTLERGQ